MGRSHVEPTPMHSIDPTSAQDACYGHFAHHDGVAHHQLLYVPEGAKRPHGRPHTT